MPYLICSLRAIDLTNCCFGTTPGGQLLPLQGTTFDYFTLNSGHDADFIIFTFYACLRKFYKTHL